MNLSLLPRLRALGSVLAFAATLLVSGCATQRQIGDIVVTSNLASLSAELGLGTESPSKPDGRADWKAASAKIEAFIAQHPDNPTTVSALRVRQAVMLLNNRQYNLAAAAFGEAKPENLRGSARDRSLKRLEPELLWWYPTAGGSFSRADFQTASNALQKISLVWTELKSPDDDGIREWLAALRAWIGLKMANDGDAQVLGADTVRGFLENAINTYASMLPKGEAEAWRAVRQFPPADVTLETAVTGSNRRRFRADDLIAGARKAIQQNALSTPQLSEPYFRERIAP